MVPHIAIETVSTNSDDDWLEIYEGYFSSERPTEDSHPSDLWLQKDMSEYWSFLQIILIEFEKVQQE